MNIAPAFICPRCGCICRHALEIYFQWCPVCAAVTGLPAQPPESEGTPELPWRLIQRNQDTCMIAIENSKPLPTAALQALPPWRAVMLARIAHAAGLGLEQGSIEQITAEARQVTGAGKLGDWWLKEAS